MFLNTKDNREIAKYSSIDNEMKNRVQGIIATPVISRLTNVKAGVTIKWG